MTDNYDDKLDDIIKRVEKSIETLMKDSHWAKYQTGELLIKALREEVDEFARSFTVRDRIKIFEEAADVLLLLLCSVYYRLPNATGESLSEILSSIVSKLHRRFSHLYNSKQLTLFPHSSSEKEFSKENNIWETSKRMELLREYSFCPNPECLAYSKVDEGNLNYISKGKFRCNVCNKEYVLTDCVLFSQMQTNYNKISESIALLFENNIGSSAFQKLDYRKKSQLQTWLNSVVNKEAAFTDFMYKRYGIVPEETRNLMNVVLRGLKFNIEKTVERKIEFHARRWNNQLAKRYILKVDKDFFIEAMTLYHYKNTELQDVTIEISNMHGCPVGCLFCAATDVMPHSNLRGIDFVAQVNSCLEGEKIDPSNYENFFVSFAGVGEPSLLAEEVKKGGEWIQRLYPHVKFNIATAGINIEAFNIWEKAKLPIRTIQISFYHNDEKILGKLVRGITFPNITTVLAKASKIQESLKECRLKVNYILISGINDSNKDILEFCKNISPFRQSITVKLSFLNLTQASFKENLKSPSLARFKEALSILNSNGYDSYIFGTEFDCMLGCGQLIKNRQEG